LQAELSKAHELNIVILQPLRISFPKRFSVDDIVVAHTVRYPRASIGRVSSVWRIPNHHGEPLFTLDLVDCLCFMGKRGEHPREHLLLNVRRWFK